MPEENAMSAGSDRMWRVSENALTPFVLLLTVFMLMGCNHASRELRQTIQDDYAAEVLEPGGLGSGDRGDDKASRIVRAAFADTGDDPLEELPVWTVLFDGFSLDRFELPPPPARPAPLAAPVFEGNEPAQPDRDEPSTEARETAADIEVWRVENGLILSSGGAGPARARAEFVAFELRLDLRLDWASVTEIGLGPAGTLTFRTTPDPDADPDDLEALPQRVRSLAAPEIAYHEAAATGQENDEIVPGFGAAELPRAGEWMRLHVLVLPDGTRRITLNEMPLPIASPAAPAAGEGVSRALVLNPIVGRAWFRNIFMRPL